MPGARATAGQAAAVREATADAQDKPADKPAASKEKPKVAKPEEKRYRFEVRDKPWSQVLEWLSDQTGLPIVCNYKLTGTFTFIPPKGYPANPGYTLGEIMDLLNEALMLQKRILVRRTASISVLPADEKIDSTLVPRVRVDDLPKRGRTELVSVVLPLPNDPKLLTAKDLGPEVKKMLGPFGEVVVLESGNQLIVQDTAGNVQRIWEVILGILVQKTK